MSKHGSNTAGGVAVSPAGRAALWGVAVITSLAWCSTAAAGEVRVAPYGTTADGHTVNAYTLVNDTGASATILDYGGAISQVLVPDRHGALGNVVLSFSDLAGWERVAHANSIIGRYANRLRGGFTLDGVHHPLQQNPGGITLHGGPPTYSTRVWTAGPIQPDDGAALTLSLDSPDGDQGFPGHVRVQATYRLADDNSLRLDFEATTDQPTVINLTNHIYFNLNGNSTTSVYGHRLALMADAIAVKDAQNSVTGELKPVSGTALDLAAGVPLGQLVLSAIDPAFAAPREGATAPPAGQLRNFDHSYVFRSGYDSLDHVVARLEDDVSGRVLEVSTTEPSVQVYVPGGPRPGLLSEVGRPFVLGSAIALETQHLPDSPNHPAFPSTVLRPGEVFRSTTVWAFKTQPASDPR